MIRSELKKDRVSICLIICPAWSVSRSPLGSVHIYSYLKHRGIIADLVDLNVKFFNKANLKTKELWELKNFEFWLDVNSVKEILLYFKDDINSFLHSTAKNKYDAIGFSIYSSNKFFSYLIAGRIKSEFPKIKLVAGGPGVFSLDDIKSIGKKAFDFFVLGEGEIVSYDLFSRILKSEEEYGEFVTEITDGDNKYYVINGNKKFIKNLDNLPYLDFERINLDDYTIKSIPLVSSRGCIGNCAFCHGRKFFPAGYRVKSPMRLFREIEYYFNTYQVSNFTFNDLIINGNIVNLEKFCDLLIESKLNISWASYAMVRSDMNESLYKKIKLSGGNTLSFGIDSFSDDTLKRMKKNYTVEDAIRTLQFCKNAGITTVVNIIVGYPDESEVDFYESLQNIERYSNLIDRFGSINMCIVNLLSDLYINREKYKLIINDRDPLGFHKWYTENNENTYEIRQNRLAQLISLINKKKINLDSSNEL